MATSAEIAAALSGLNISPLDTPYGLGANVIAKSLPNLYNPYASVGSNLGVTLGGALLAGLLGYQAKQQAREQNIALQPLVTEAFQATTPEQLQGVIAKPGGERLTDLANQLYIQQLVGKQTTAQNEADLRKSVMLEAVKQGYQPPQYKELFAAPPPSGSEDLGIDMSGINMAGVTPKVQQEIAQKALENKIIKAPERIDDARKSLTKAGDNATQVANMYNSIEMLLGQDSLAADNEIARMGTKIGDPTSVTSPKEAEARIAVMPKLTQYKKDLEAVISSGSKLSDQARADLLNAFKPYVEAAKNSYAQQYELTRKRLESEKLIQPNDPEAGTKLLPFPIPETSGSQKALERLKQIKTEIVSGSKAPADIESLKKEANDLAQIYGPVWRVMRPQ